MVAELTDSLDRTGLSISMVSARLGVPMPTLRSWELRYGIPDGDRTAGTHRRYQPDQLHALRLMRDEIARGQRAATAARSVRAQLGLAGPGRDMVAAFLAASGRRDPVAMRAALDQAVAILGVDGCVDDVLLPGMRQIGVWWRTGLCDQDDEHLATETVRSWLSVMTSFAPAPAHSNPILFSTGPADLHTIGIEALAMMMRYRRWAGRSLGARVPTAAVTMAAQGAGAAAVVIVSHLATARHRAIESMRAIDRVGIPLFYAGNAFSTARGRLGLPGTYLGTGLGRACGTIDLKLRG